jgi:hypothetical protein
VLGEAFLDCVKGFSELILPAQNKHTREMIHTLIRPKPKQSIGALGDITPINIEFLKTRLLETTWRLFFFD